MAITAVQLAAVIGTDSTRAAGLLAVCADIVDGYAPTAPDPIRDEATIRLAGYLAQSDYGGIMSESLGPMTVRYPTNHAGLLIRSGALTLLTRWRRRRAGAV